MCRVRFRGRDRVRSMFWTIMLLAKSWRPLYIIDRCVNIWYILLSYYNKLYRLVILNTITLIRMM